MAATLAKFLKSHPFGYFCENDFTGGGVWASGQYEGFCDGPLSRGRTEDKMMEICEFKAWFEGFTEDMTKPPSAKQWKRIKQRVEQVDGTPTTERVFIDRYWRRYEPYWVPGPFWSGGSLTSTNAPELFSNYVSNMVVDPGLEGLNVTTAFVELGKAEAASMTA